MIRGRMKRPRAVNHSAGRDGAAWRIPSHPLANDLSRLPVPGPVKPGSARTRYNCTQPLAHALWLQSTAVELSPDALLGKPGEAQAHAGGLHRNSREEIEQAIADYKHGVLA